MTSSISTPHSSRDAFEFFSLLLFTPGWGWGHTQAGPLFPKRGRGFVEAEKDGIHPGKALASWVSVLNHSHFGGGGEGR